MKKLFLVLIGIAFTAVNAMAGNVDTYGIGAKATALGGAFAATADDPSAMYYNPAGLTQIKTPVISAGAMIMSPSIEIREYHVENSSLQDIGPSTYGDSSPPLVVPNLGFAMPVNDNWSAGISIYAPFGLQLEWERELADNPGINNVYESKYDRIAVTPTIAYKLNAMWSFGFGVALGKSDGGQFYENYSLSTLGGSKTNVEVDTSDDFNWSYNLGVMFKPTDKWSFGLTYRSECDVNFEGTMKIGGAGGPVADANGEYDVEINDTDAPAEVQVGARYMPIETLSMEIDFVLTRWSAIRHQTLTYSNNAPLGISTPVYTPRNWDDTLQIRLGTEWKATEILSLRGGYYYDQSPIPDDTFDLVWADADKHTFSLGFGIALGNWTIDAVGQYTRIVGIRDITPGQSHNLDHSYSVVNPMNGSSVNSADVSLDAKGYIWGYGLTLSYAF